MWALEFAPILFIMWWKKLLFQNYIGYKLSLIFGLRNRSRYKYYWCVSGEMGKGVISPYFFRLRVAALVRAYNLIDVGVHLQLAKYNSMVRKNHEILKRLINFILILSSRSWHLEDMMRVKTDNKGNCREFIDVLSWYEDVLTFVGAFVLHM